MARFTYRIDRHFSDTEGWGIENDDARGTEDYDGTAQDYAREVLGNRIADVESDRLTGQWRVLVWEGDEERDGGPEDADGWAETIRTEANYPNPGGRPKIGNNVSIAMGDTLAPVDAYRAERKLSRAEAVRTLVTAALAPDKLTWSVVRGESPDSRAVEPGTAGIDIPDAILAWAENHGLDDADPDVYLLVTPEDEAGEVNGEIAYTTLVASHADALLVRQALAEDE